MSRNQAFVQRPGGIGALASTGTATPIGCRERGIKSGNDSLSSHRAGMDQTVRQEMLAMLPRLRRFAYGLTGSIDGGDDLVQSACERALARLHQWEPGTR